LIPRPVVQTEVLRSYPGICAVRVLPNLHFGFEPEKRSRRIVVLTESPTGPRGVVVPKNGGRVRSALNGSPFTSGTIHLKRLKVEGSYCHGGSTEAGSCGKNIRLSEGRGFAGFPQHSSPQPGGLSSREQLHLVSLRGHRPIPTCCSPFVRRRYLIPRCRIPHASSKTLQM
jgi:hypothetical protein